MIQTTFDEMGMSLEEKIIWAVDLLKGHQELALRRDPQHGYYLAFSGGKDSVVIKALADMSGVKYQAHYHITTIDPPELVKFIRHRHPSVVMDRPRKGPFFRRLLLKGLPTRRARWCCAEFKEGGGKGKITILGVRHAESVSRRKLWKPLTALSSAKVTVNPILFWTDSDVWEFIKSRKIPYCGLYDEGFHRLGCVGCPMAGSGRIAEFERWPALHKAWMRAAKKYWETTTHKSARRFETWQAMWDWWLHDQPYPHDDCNIGLF